MGLDIREWMLLAGGILFLLVVIDGVRRVLADRKEEVRLSKNARKGFPSLYDGDAPEPKNSELVGSARVVPRANRSNKSEADNDKDDVPVLLDTLDADELDALDGAPQPAEQPAPASTVSQGALDLEAPLPTPEPEPALEPQSIPEQQPEIQTRPRNEANTNAARDTTEPSPNTDPLGEVEHVIIINVHAQPGSVLHGQTMLELLLSHGVRFGKMDIFHRRESLADSQRVQFSIANSVEPGTFDLDTFDTFTTPGVTFFMQLPGPKKPMDAFKSMLTVANALAQNSGGRLLDEQRNPASQQTLEHLKQQVEDFERRSLAKRRT